jgi:hypothetical protein
MPLTGQLIFTKQGDFRPKILRPYILHLNEPSYAGKPLDMSERGILAKATVGDFRLIQYNQLMEGGAA